MTPRRVSNQMRSARIRQIPAFISLSFNTSSACALADFSGYKEYEITAVTMPSSANRCARGASCYRSPDAHTPPWTNTAMGTLTFSASWVMFFVLVVVVVIIFFPRRIDRAGGKYTSNFCLSSSPYLKSFLRFSRLFKLHSPLSSVFRNHLRRFWRQFVHEFRPNAVRNHRDYPSCFVYKEFGDLRGPLELRVMGNAKSAGIALIASGRTFGTFICAR